MNTTTQAILDWARLYIPDSKTRLKSVRGLEIGRTTVATALRETFYLKHSAIGSVFLYVDPYTYSSTASLKIAATTDKVFLFNATLQSCIFPKSSEKSIRPDQFKPVLADYEYSERQPYFYTDTELATFLPLAISYLNNTYEFSYTYTGTISTLIPSTTTDSAKELMAKALAIIVRKDLVDEQKRKGYGVRFRGPMMSLDNVQAMKSFEEGTAQLEKSIAEKRDVDKIGGMSTGQGIDVYTENVVTK